MGFCRTNLFKRLESSGQAFIQSIERHILRNFVYLHAIENDLPLPIGTQDAGLLDARFTDADQDLFAPEDDEDNDAPERRRLAGCGPRPSFGRRAAEVYAPVRRTAQAALSLAARRPLSAAARQGPARRQRRPAGVLHAMRRLGPRPRRQARRRSLDLLTQEHPGQEGARLHPVRRHRALPCRHSCRPAGSAALAASPATPRTRRSLPGASAP